MFDLRLGLALGKSLGEIRLLPYPEVKLWRLFFLLEPWGFHDEEYRTAAILAQLHNTNVSKKHQLKKIDFFMRDMPKKIMGIFAKKKKEQNLPVTEPSVPPVDVDSPEARAMATENTIRLFENMFGKRVVRKDKQ